MSRQVGHLPLEKIIAFHGDDVTVDPRVRGRFATVSMRVNHEMEVKLLDGPCEDGTLYFVVDETTMVEVFA